MPASTDQVTDVTERFPSDIGYPICHRYVFIPEESLPSRLRLKRRESADIREQTTGRYVERTGDLDDIQQTDVPFTAFYSSDVRPVKVRSFGQFLL